METASAFFSHKTPRMSRTASTRAFSLALLVASACLLLAATATAGGQKTYVSSQCNNAVFKPKTIGLACGDAGLAATKLKWSSWTGGSATGVGTGRVELCEPNCAEGKVAHAPMRVVLSRPKLCPQDGKRHFTKVRYTWLEDAPTGPKSAVTPLPCALLASAD